MSLSIIRPWSLPHYSFLIRHNSCALPAAEGRQHWPVLKNPAVPEVVVVLLDRDVVQGLMKHLPKRHTGEEEDTGVSILFTAIKEEQGLLTDSGLISLLLKSKQL